MNRKAIESAANRYRLNVVGSVERFQGQLLHPIRQIPKKENARPGRRRSVIGGANLEWIEDHVIAAHLLQRRLDYRCAIFVQYAWDVLRQKKPWFGFVYNPEKVSKQEIPSIVPIPAPDIAEPLTRGTANDPRD